MKQLVELIKEQFVYEKLEQINNEIINESLKAPILKELAKQLLDQINKEKKEKEDDKYRSIYNKSFKQIFGDSHIPWNEIEDKDIETIEAQTWNEKKLKTANEKLIRSIIKCDKHAIIISRDPETKIFEYVILNWGNMFYLRPGKGSYWSNNYAGSITGQGGGRHYKDLNQREKIDLLNNKTLYIIDTTNLRVQGDKIVHDRYVSKQGVIDFDPESLRRIARDNVERYKKILSQRKATNQNNDKLLDEANEIIKKISDITIQVAKDPLSYADVLSKVAILSKYVYDERRYVPGRTPRQQGYYTGVNGLIPLVAKYVEAIKDAKSGWDWGSKNIDSSVKVIQDTITKCKDLLKEIEELL